MRETNAPFVSAVVLAAGASSRMNEEDKLTKPLLGSNLLRRATIAALNSKADEVVVTLPLGRTKRMDTVADLPVRTVISPFAGMGMAHSLRSAVESLDRRTQAALIVLPDMPLIESNDLDLLLREFSEGSVVRATNSEDAPGNPVIVPKQLFAEICKLKGDSGARSVLKGFAGMTRMIPLSGPKAILDLDTQEDWREFLASDRDASGSGGGT